LQEVFVNDDGYGYTSAPIVTVSRSPAGVTSALGAVVAFTTSIGNLQAVDFVAIGNPGFAYTEPPSFTFGGPGAGAAATASLTNSGITSIRITQPGFNYASPPTITIQHPSEVGIGTTGAVVGIKTGQVQATARGVLQGDVLKNILILNAGSGYEGTPTVTISGPLNAGVGTYFGNERVVGSISGTEGYVKKWDLTNRKLQISINTGAFLPGEFITGTASSARYQVFSYSDTDTAPYADDYFSNDEIEAEADDLLDFSETNPFGTF
jgi:hypothetical protein